MGSIDPLRVMEHLHGHLGWLAAATVVHPAILLRRPRRRADLSVALAVGVLTAVGALGIALYEPYRDRLKQGIFQHAPAVGYLFERKEHAAFAALALAWGGAIAYVAAARARDEAVRAPLRVIAWRAFVASAVLAVITAALGTSVAVYRTF